MREIRDLLFQPDQINPMIDAVAARIAAIAPADLARWSYATPAGSAYSSMGMPGPGFTGGVAGYVQDMKDFMFIGGPKVGGWIASQ